MPTSRGVRQFASANFQMDSSMAEDCLRHAQRLVVRLRFMHAEKFGAEFAAVAGEGDGGPEAVVHGFGMSEAAKEGFSRDADEDGAPERNELRERTEERK